MFDGLIAVSSNSVLNMPPWLFWLSIIAISGFCLTAFYRMTRWFQQGQLMANIPTAKIRSAAQGYVELSGTAKLMDGPIIVSPLTGKSCVWYRYTIEERAHTRGRGGKSDSSWHVVERGRSDALFLLEDQTGQCVIDPDDADVTIGHNKTWHKRHVSPPRRYNEQLIRAGDPLYAIGFFKTVANIEQQQTRQQVAQVLNQWKQDPGQLLHQFDLDRNGQIDSDEWEQARQTAEREVHSQHGLQAKEAPLNVMMSSDVSDQAYILSSEPEAVLIKQYRQRALKSMLLFFMLGSLTIWALNTRVII